MTKQKLMCVSDSVKKKIGQYCVSVEIVGNCQPDVCVCVCVNCICKVCVLKMLIRGCGNYSLFLKKKKKNLRSSSRDLCNLSSEEAILSLFRLPSCIL